MNKSYINEICHFLLFIMGITVIIIYKFEFENIAVGILLSYVTSYIAIIWTSYTFFDNKKWKEKVETIKFLNQKGLESYKLYIIKKHQTIISVYEAMHNMIETIDNCIAYDSTRNNLNLDYYTMSENTLKEILKCREIINKDEQYDILTYWRQKQFQKKGNPDMDRYINMVQCIPENKKMESAIISVSLYLNQDTLIRIKNLSDALIKLSYEIISQKSINALHKFQIIKTEFEGDIILMLKKELLDTDSSINT